jgi:hypothetical protein
MVIKNRLELAKYFAALGFIKGAEIGVLEGHYSMILLDIIPDLKLLCVDNWKYLPSHELVRQRAYKNLENRATIIPKHSMEALADVEDGSLDFVYIDANHQYHSVIDDITGWAKKVRVGGIVAGDDYYDIPGSKWGVIEAVTEFTKNPFIPVNITDWDFSQGIEDTHPQYWFWKE